MPTTRDFWWTVEPSREIHWTREAIKSVVDFYAQHDKGPRIVDWDISSGALGKEVLQLRLRVRGRDWHAAGQHAQDVAVTALLRAKAKGAPFSIPLKPHTSRGRAVGARPRGKTVRRRIQGVLVTDKGDGSSRDPHQAYEGQQQEQRRA